MTVDWAVAIGLGVNLALVASSWGRSEYRAGVMEKRQERIENALGVGQVMDEAHFVTKTEQAKIEQINDTAFKRIEDRLANLERWRR